MTILLVSDVGTEKTKFGNLRDFELDYGNLDFLPLPRILGFQVNSA